MIISLYVKQELKIVVYKRKCYYTGLNIVDSRRIAQRSADANDAFLSTFIRFFISTGNYRMSSTTYF